MKQKETKCSMHENSESIRRARRTRSRALKFRTRKSREVLVLVTLSLMMRYVNYLLFCIKNILLVFSTEEVTSVIINANSSGSAGFKVSSKGRATDLVWQIACDASHL